MKVTWETFATRYCKTQMQTPEGLAEALRIQINQYNPEGFFMVEAQLFGSFYFGQVVILPYGPNNPFKTIPDHPFSPRGLESDTSVVIQHITADEVP